MTDQSIGQQPHVPTGPAVAHESPHSATPSTAAASPLPYLHDEEKYGDRQASEALLCTFNADLGFFERTALGVIQATGARTTVIGDAQMHNPDPRAARNAGLRYVHGVAAPYGGGAFHPKVTVLVGPQRAIVAVGSGNLSTGGWHLNAETWTIATADRERCPILIPQLAEWLRTLPDVCAITPQAVDGIRRTATALQELANASFVKHTGHHLVHTSGGPIVDTLPHAPIADLQISAPFHDPKAVALGELLNRLQPRRLTLVVQPGQTILQPSAILRTVTEYTVPVSVREDLEPAYRHGKLIQAVLNDGSLWTLTGSPNLTAAALLRPVLDGGNVELGVLARPCHDLLPHETIPAELANIPAKAIPPALATATHSGVVLLAAARSLDGLQVTFANPVTETVNIQASLYEEYDTWNHVGTVPPDSTQHTLTGVDLPGGSRIRAAWGTGNGIRYSAAFYVIDTARALSRVLEGGRRTNHDRHPIELIEDERLRQAWFDTLRDIAAAQRAISLPRLPGSTPSADGDKTEQTPRLDTDVEDWLAYTDNAQARLGPTMYRVALGGLAVLRATPPQGDHLLTPSDQVADERSAGLDDDETDIVTDPDPASQESDQELSSTTTGIETDETRVRKARHHEGRKLRQIVHELAPELAAIDRLALGNLVFIGLEAGFWPAPHGEDGWISVLCKVLEHLDRGDVAQPMVEKVASYAAVALYLIRDHLPYQSRTSDVVAYERSLKQTSHLLSDVNEDLIRAYAEPVRNSRGFPIDLDAAMHTIKTITRDDPLADVTDLLTAQHPDRDIHQHSPQVIHIHGEFGNHIGVAADLLDNINTDGAIAVWATSPDGRWALAARQGPSLFHIGPQKETVTWRHYQLTQLTTAARIARDPEIASIRRVNRGPLTHPIPEALQLLRALSIDIADGPPTTCLGAAAAYTPG